MELDNGLAIAEDIKPEPMDQQYLQEDDFELLEDSITIENTMMPKREDSADDNPDYSDPKDDENVSSSNDKVKKSITKCLHDPKYFCYVCGVYVYNKKLKLLPIGSRPYFRKLYSDYFGLQVHDENEPWIPNSVCSGCYKNLDNWYKGKGKGLPFGTPRIWSKPSENHFEDCYFCLSCIGTRERQHYYPDLPTAKAPDFSKIAPGRDRARLPLVDLPIDSNDMTLETTDKVRASHESSIKVKLEPFDEEQDLLANCLKRPDDFCFICGAYIKRKMNRSLNSTGLWKNYKEYFETNDDPPSNPWEPKSSCITCANQLSAWSKRKGDGLPFGTPRTWSKPSHNTPIDCFFCMVHVNGRRVRNPHLDIPSSRAPDYTKIAPGRFKVPIPVEAQNPAEPGDPDEEESKPFANCKHQPDEFCFVCGCHIKSVSKSRSGRLSSSLKLWIAYKEYFQLDVNPPTQPWEPKFACAPCKGALLGWSTGKNHFLKFAVPRRWREPGTDHATDCYFCLAGRLKGPVGCSRWSYPDLPSSRAPVPVDADHPRPERRRIEVEEQNHVEVKCEAI